MNIDDKTQLRECTSCQMCGAVCPVDAISISLNEQGFYRPYINSEKCIDCGLCVKSCYKFDRLILHTQNYEGKRMFSAWAKDRSVVESTTSGGVADILASELVNKGYKCIGVEYDNVENRAVAKVASSKENIIPFRGSKYIQAYTECAFKELVKTQKNVKYAVFGLPCQIYALDRFLRTKGTRNNHLLIDLYCHGCPSLNLWDKYINEIIRKTDGRKVISANFRSKVRGWGNYYVEVVVEGKFQPVTYVSPRTDDPFYTMFFSDKILNDSCYSCKLRSTLEYTDIRLGDFWGNKFVSNHTGVSGVTVCSENGMKVFDSIKNKLNFEEQTFASFIPYQSYGKEYNCDKEIRDILLSQLADESIPLKTTVNTYKKSLPIKSRLVLEAKNIVKLLPNSLISSLKGIAYNLKN